METQLDYETEPILAVFRSPEEAEVAIEALRAAGLSDGNVTHVKLEPGHYQSEDHSLHDEGDGVRRGAVLGVPIGAAVGLGLAAVLPSGAGPFVVAGLAGMGALDGMILGGFVGAIARAHFDDDVASSLEIHEGGTAVLVVVRAGGATNEAARAREALQRAGALAFLDATVPGPEPAPAAVIATPGIVAGQPLPPVSPA